MSKETITGKFEVVDRETATYLIGHGVHTGLRKGTEAPNSGVLWRGIQRSSDSSWSDAVQYCIDNLEGAGYRIVKVADA